MYNKLHQVVFQFHYAYQVVSRNFLIIYLKVVYNPSPTLINNILGCLEHTNITLLHYFCSNYFRSEASKLSHNNSKSGMKRPRCFLSNIYNIIYERMNMHYVFYGSLITLFY